MRTSQLDANDDMNLCTAQNTAIVASIVRCALEFFAPVDPGLGCCIAA